MKVAFRVDSGVEIGGGHLNRCLTLATELKLHGVVQCFFFMREHLGNSILTVEKMDFEVISIPMECKPNYYNGDYSEWVGGDLNDDASTCLIELAKLGFQDGDWIIVDHYGLDDIYEKKFLLKGYNVGVIDDLVNRNHHSTFLLDQTCGRKKEEYKNLVSQHTQLFTGENYCLLRPEFSKLRKKSLNYRRSFITVKNVFINFGTTDPLNITLKVLRDIECYIINNSISVVVVIGSQCPHIEELSLFVLVSKANIELNIDANNIADLMSVSDVAIGAAGSTTWERCCLGLPSILIKIADNQIDVVNRVEQFGAAIQYDLENGNLRSNLKNLIDILSENYFYYVENSMNLIDGKGVQRIVDYMLNKSEI